MKQKIPSYISPDLYILGIFAYLSYTEQGWIAYDISSNTFIEDKFNKSGFNNWQDYKNHIIEKDKTKKPQWKF